MNKRKKKLTIVSICLISGLILMFFNPLKTHAIFDFSNLWGEDTEETVRFLREHSEWLQFGSFFSVIGHEFGWWVTKGFFNVSKFLEGMIPQSLNLLDFLDDAGMQGITKAVINDLVVALMVLTIVFLGIKTIVSKNPPKFKSVGVNIFISAFLILGMPTLMSTMQDISLEFYDATQTGEDNQISSLSWGLIKDNTADLIYAANQDFSPIKNDVKEKGQKNALTPEIFKAVNLSELITPDVIDDLPIDSKELESLKYTLSTDGQGNYTATEIKNSMLSFFSDSFDSGYFRYSVKFTPIIVGLAALSFSYLLTIFIFATTVVEIGFKKVIGLFVFATDLESGERTKMVVRDIMNAFMLIAFTGLSLKMYTLFLTFLSTSDLNILIYVVSIVSATFILLRGSNTIMRYFGVDVGLKDGFAQMAGAFAIGRTTSSLFRQPLRNHSSPKAKANAKDALASQREGKLNKSVNSAGKALGYAKNRGVAGIAEDAIKGTGEKATNKFNAIKDQWNDGVSEGVMSGEKNKEKWSGKNKSVNDIDDIHKDMTNYGPEKQNLKDEIKDNNIAKNKENPTTTLQESEVGKSNEEILKDIELNNAFKSNNDTDSVNENMRLNPNKEKTINDTGDMKPINHNKSETISIDKQDAAQNIKPGLQKIKQQVEKIPLDSNPEKIKQNVIQEIEKGSFGSNNVKQKIVQEIEKSNIPTPEQLKQNVEQVLSSTKLPNEVQNSIQKIVQETDSTSYNPENVKAKIVQEIEKADMDDIHSKQTVIQDVRKAFTATPEQTQQNIKQVIKTIDNEQIINSGQQEIKKKVVKEKETIKKDSKDYFGSLLPDDLKEFPEVKKKSKSRFDVIK